MLGIGDGIVRKSLHESGISAVGIMIVIIHAAWLLAGASLAGFLRDPLRSRLANIAFALVLIATAILALMR